ncbi:MAG TPA: Stp1/IreP family PP2C-type Ser/Thr phosphatase [Candidatus Acidoferrales bacterium]|nr:Stp1/IreP family PP2C-type Ser/Thr phosphatase [Candidatus Acidoferrales bacterium]
MLTKSLEGDVVQIVSGGVSDVGRVRTNNEDSFRVLEALNLFILSDGMGGEAHGEVASAMAVETVEKFCSNPDASKEDSGVTLHGAASDNWSPQTKILQNAVFQANFNIYQSAQKHPEQRGMGATLTTGWLNESKLSIAHVGDSRAYLLRTGALQQLTNDHSLVAEQVRRGILTPQQAEESEMQSVLLRALGANPEVDVEVDEVDLMPRDVLLFCSDGLTRMVSEPEIAGKLQAETDPGTAAQKLVDLANERGGLDNVTVIVVRVQDDSKGWFSWLRRDSGKKD